MDATTASAIAAIAGGTSAIFAGAAFGFSIFNRRAQKRLGAKQREFERAWQAELHQQDHDLQVELQNQQLLFEHHWNTRFFEVPRRQMLEAHFELRDAYLRPGYDASGIARMQQALQRDDLDEQVRSDVEAMSTMSLCYLRIENTGDSEAWDIHILVRDAEGRVFVSDEGWKKEAFLPKHTMVNESISARFNERKAPFTLYMWFKDNAHTQVRWSQEVKRAFEFRLLPFDELSGGIVLDKLVDKLTRHDKK